MNKICKTPLLFSGRFRFCTAARPKLTVTDAANLCAELFIRRVEPLRKPIHGRSNTAHRVTLRLCYAFRENRSMPFTAGVGRADEVFKSFFVDFLIVDDAFSVRTMTKNQPIRWMVEPKVFHEFLQ